MPRYYRRRYTRVLKPKKKWASCIDLWKNKQVDNPFIVVLAANSAQSSTPTPSIVKVGNFKVTADMTATYGSTPELIGASLFVLFVPEGIQDSQIPGLVTQHPEYIMLTKVVGSGLPSESRTVEMETVNVSSRMKRNLNSGDKIVMLIDFHSTVGPDIVRLTGNVRYWCCTN